MCDNVTVVSFNSENLVTLSHIVSNYSNIATLSVTTVTLSHIVTIYSNKEDEWCNFTAA